MATATRLRERSILFSDEMVRAILDGRKTQTRRVIKPQPRGDVYVTTDGRGWADMDELQVHSRICRPMPYQVGMRLWVKETWADTTGMDLDEEGIVYRATDPDWSAYEGFKWRPSIHMPRWASRITLEVLEVRVQRVQEISEEDADAEGCPAIVAPPRVVCGETIDMNVSAIERYRDLWNSLNLRHGFGWDANPWVRAVTFQRVTTEHAEVSDEAHHDGSQRTAGVSRGREDLDL